MKPKIIKNNQIEVISNKGLDLNILKKKTSAKTYSGWLIGKIKESREVKNFETAKFLEEQYKKYIEYYPERKFNMKAQSWKGKSSFEIKRREGFIEIIKYKRKDIDSEPEKIVTEITLEELSTLINSIKDLFEEKPIPTKVLARMWCKKLKIEKRDDGKWLFEGDFWDNFFSWRGMHTKLCLCLDTLDYHGFIKYSRKGFTTLLKKNLELQEVLNVI